MSQSSNPFLNPPILHSLPAYFTSLVDSKGSSDKKSARFVEVPKATQSSSLSSSHSFNPFLPLPINSSHSEIMDRSANPLSKGGLISKSSQLIMEKEAAQAQFQKKNPYDNQSKHAIEINCPICHEKYGSWSNIPKVLYCGHSVCSQCLNKIHLQGNWILCPICSCREWRQFAAIPINYAIFGLTGENKPVDLCKVHQKEIGLFCKDDNKQLCINCMIEHYKHEVTLLDDPIVLQLAEQKKQEIEQLRFEFQGKFQHCEKVLEKLREDQESIEISIRNNSSLLEESRIKLFSLIEKASKKAIEEKNKYGNEALIRNSRLKDTYIASKNKYFKRLEEINELAKEFDKSSIAKQINCEVKKYKEESAMPEIEDIAEIISELIEPVDYEVEILKHFNDLLKIN